jgi:hypothetical protein
MDKQEAIDYVLDELDKGRSRQEITAALSRKLGAPVELVGKFVWQTAERYEQSKVQSRQPTGVSQQPTAYSRQPTDQSRQTKADNRQPTAYSRQPTAGSLSQTAYQREAAVEPIPEPNRVYEATPVEAAPVLEAAPARQLEQEAAVTPDLEKFILDELGQNKRDSDIVLQVVERTGWDYQRAQRMVSRVGARNYKKVTARQNCLIIPLALVFLIAGLILLGASIAEGYQLRFILNSPNNLTGEQIQLAYERGRNLPWAFGLGLALSLGGSFGLFSAVRKQTE